MTSTNFIRRGDRPTRRDVPIHLYTVGQAVRMNGGFTRPTLPTAVFHITGTLPPHGDSPQYRIRSEDERHERVTTQDYLEPVDVSSAGPSIIERTFGYGQGTEAQQPRDQKAKAGKGPNEA